MTVDFPNLLSKSICVCVGVCVCEREREREREYLYYPPTCTINTYDITHIKIHYKELISFTKDSNFPVNSFLRVCDQDNIIL